MLTIEHLIDLDIKHETSIWTPTIMRGDSVVLLFRAHDNNSNEKLKKFDKAELTLVMPSGITITENCVKQNLNGIDLARFEFKKIHSIEVGTYQMYLTLIQGADRVSVPPFPIEVDDNVSQDDYAFMEIIKGLEDQLAELAESINKGVPLESINVANGVAGLDSMKKIPPALLLDYFDKHITTAMYKDGAHGFKLDETTKRPWVLVNGTWKEAKYSEKPMGAGAPMPIPTIAVQNGYAIVTFKEPVSLSLRKWTYGLQNTTWFRTNGTTASTNTFPVSQIGEHTFYYKLEDGRDNTVVFQVTKEGLDSGTVKPIEEFKDGDLVKFGNLEWIVLDAKKGYLLSRFSVADRQFDVSTGDKSFDPNDESNIAHYLNTTFLNGLPAPDRIRILETVWQTGNEGQEGLTTAKSLVGLMSFSEVNSYKHILDLYPEWNDSIMFYKGFFTLTENSSDKNQVWRVETNTVEWSLTTVPKNVPVLIRPAIHLLGGTLVEPVVKDENIPLSQFNDGDMVKFSDKRWRVLDKNQGLIIYDDIPIYRPVKNIWENFLNTSFYLNLNGQAKSFIQSNDWDMSNPTETPMSKKITAYVGLLSLPMFNTYKTKLSHLIESKMFWTSTKGHLEGLQVAINTTDGYFGNYVQVSEDFDYQVVPVIKVSQNATFGRLKEQIVELSSIKKNERIWLGNYPWVKGNNNDLILDYDYDMDSEPKKVSFSSTDSSDYFSKTTDNGNIRNAGTDVNSKFILDRLFYRVSKNLTDREFNIGFANNPTSEKGFFKAGLINTNTWRDDYQSNLTNLQVKEDFWLMNPLDADNAFYVSALDRQAKTASVTDIQKITKPVLRLEPTTKVQQYVKDEKDFAYIPDPVVRGQLNLNLGKGSANNPDTSQITIEEMQSITFFDSLGLTEASDLTGLELLTNCTFVRMRHDEGKPFNITNFTPLNKLGEARTLTRLNIYGVPEGDSSLTIYNQLKGKFPYLNEGGVYTNSHEKILISLAELKGIEEGIYLTELDILGGGFDPTIYRARFKAYGKEPINYVRSGRIENNKPLEEWDLQQGFYEITQDFEVPYADTNIRPMHIYIEASNSTSKDLDAINIYFDNQFKYTWTERKKAPTITDFPESRQSGEKVDMNLPATVKGLTIVKSTIRLSNAWKVRNITIPATYQEIDSLLYGNLGVEKVYVYNDNIKWTNESAKTSNPIFQKGQGSGGEEIWTPVPVTFYARQNSTTYQEYLKVIEKDERPLYNFSILP